MFSFNFDPSPKDTIEDIHDGMIYNTIYAKEIQNDKSNKFFTLLFNTDGIELCQKSDIAIWPMIFVINELQIEKRFSFDNCIIAGIFYFLYKFISLEIKNINK